MVERVLDRQTMRYKECDPEMRRFVRVGVAILVVWPAFSAVQYRQRLDGAAIRFVLEDRSLTYDSGVPF